MSLVTKLRAGEGDFLLFGITPPKASAAPEDLERITSATLARVQSLSPDGVALYDIAEEQDRNPADRPFPFLPTLDPAEYLEQHFTSWEKPSVIYRAVGKYTEEDLGRWISEQNPSEVVSVLVGASSSKNIGTTSLRRAYELRAEHNPELIAGAVVIPERHAQRGDEHLRMFDKQDAGVSFFVSQILFDVTAAKNLVARYADECEKRGVAPKPIAFTISVCGSVKTLEFLAWLGVEVPFWMERDLRRAESALEASYQLARDIAVDMVSYCRRLGVPVGLNVESVSTRKVEIETAVQLAADLRGVLGA